MSVKVTQYLHYMARVIQKNNDVVSLTKQEKETIAGRTYQPNIFITIFLFI